MPAKKQCEIGWTKMDRAAVRKWTAEAGKCRGPGSVSSSVHAPPAQGSAAAVKCMGKWMACWQEAQAIDALNVDITKLQALLIGMRAMKPAPAKLIASTSKMIAGKQSEVQKKMIAFGYQQQAYIECVKGMKV